MLAQDRRQRSGRAHHRSNVPTPHPRPLLSLPALHLERQRELRVVIVRPHRNQCPANVRVLRTPVFATGGVDYVADENARVVEAFARRENSPPLVVGVGDAEAAQPERSLRDVVVDSDPVPDDVSIVAGRGALVRTQPRVLKEQGRIGGAPDVL